MWWFSVALAAGCWFGPIALGGGWPVVPVLALAGLIVRRGLVAAALLCAAGYLVGAAALQQGLDRRLPRAADGQELLLSGTITGLPEHGRLQRGHRAGSCRRSFTLEPDGAPGLPLAGTVDLTLYEHCVMLRPGDRVRLRARLFTPRARVNRAGYDSARRALAENRAAQGYVVDWLEHRRGDGGVDALRWRLSERIRTRLADWPRAARLVPALVTGDRRHLNHADWSLLRRTGTAHLIAISGLHITLVTGLVWTLFRYCPPFWRRRGVLSAQQLAVVPALAAGCFYAALAGFSLPTRRALVMTALVLLALAWRRDWSRAGLLGVTLVTVLIWQPLSALATGFWLSFGAVALLVLVAGRGPRALVRAQCVLSLGMGAVTGWLFGGWGLAAPLANLALIPLFSVLVVPLALGGALADPTGKLLDGVARVLELALGGVEWLAGQLPHWPVPATLAGALLAGLGVLVLLAPGAVLPRWSAPLLLLPWFWPGWPVPEPGGFHLTVFDAGQGQAVAVRTHERIILYDLGPAWSGGNTGRTLLRPWLEKERAPVTLAFASHGDRDHAGGLKGVRERIPPRALFSGEPGRVAGARACRRGQRWRFDGVRVAVLWPAPGIELRNSNNRSCVVRIAGDHGSVLLTGDIEKPVEYWLARRGGLDSDILQVPHHGSRSSSSYSFLRAVEPRQAFVTTGHRNGFGHPAASVRKRYRQLGTAFYNSAHTGMIVFRRDDQHNAAPILWRAREARPWRAPP